MSFNYDRSEKKFNICASQFSDGSSAASAYVLSPAGREEGDAAASAQRE